MLRRLALTLSLGFACGMGQAETVPLATNTIDTCLSELGARMDKRVCVGLAARKCAENAATAACMEAEITYWDARLDAGYAMAMHRAEGKDSDARHLQLVARDQSGALKSAQEHWKRYRTATCAFEQTLWGSGAANAPEVRACHLYLTAEQVFYLEAVALIE